MGLFDLLRSIVRRAEVGDPTVPQLGTVARSYVETGEPPDESWLDHEGPNGELDVVVTVEAGPGHWPSEEAVAAVEREIRNLGGTVEESTETGVLMAELSKTELAALADYDRVRQLEVTRGREAAGRDTGPTP